MPKGAPSNLATAPRRRGTIRVLAVGTMMLSNNLRYLNKIKKWLQGRPGPFRKPVQQPGASNKERQRLSGMITPKDTSGAQRMPR